MKKKEGEGMEERGGRKKGKEEREEINAKRKKDGEGLEEKGGRKERKKGKEEREERKVKERNA